MRFHRMKITAGFLETIVNAAAEGIENFAKLRFGALAKSVFFLRHRTIQLLEAERAAPGRELAYMISARETFGSSGAAKDDRTQSGCPTSNTLK